MEKDTRFIHPAFDGAMLGLYLLKEGAVAMAGAVRPKRTRAKKSHRGQALHAGVDTPMWNALAAALKAECRRRGDQTRLARMVGLPRQRMHNFLHGNGGLPDAERTLMLLGWLVAQHHPNRKSSAKPTRSS